MTRAKHTTTPESAPAFIGIDLAKNSVHVHGVDQSGRHCVDRKLKEYLVNLAPCVVGMEACGCAHQWGRDVRAMGHDAKLMVSQFTKPYVKSNKNGRAGRRSDLRGGPAIEYAFHGNQGRAVRLPGDHDHNFGRAICPCLGTDSHNGAHPSGDRAGP